MKKAILLLTLLATGILGGIKHSRDSREIGKIKGSIAPASFIEKAFSKAVEKRCGFVLVSLVVDGVEEKVVYHVPIDSGGATDATYFAPDVSEIDRLISKAKNSMEYVPEVYDCDDFSRHFKDVLLVQWAKEGNIRPLPIFEVYAAIFLPDTNEVVYHAFNAIVTNEGKLVFIEPQDPRPIAFSKAKILRIFFAGA